jgi:hypothetical protein
MFKPDRNLDFNAAVTLPRRSLGHVWSAGVGNDDQDDVPLAQDDFGQGRTNAGFLRLALERPVSLSQQVQETPYPPEI